VRKMCPNSAGVLDSLNCHPGFWQVPVRDVPVIGHEQGMRKVYGRFMGGSDQNTDNPGRFEQSEHFMHMAQSRMITGDCASG